jgi:transcriptional regulator with XRE-family HTH domain
VQRASNEPSDSALLPKEAGKRLRLLRERAGLSQEAVALMLGLDRRTGKAQISKMETGHYRSGPGFVRLLDYLRACGCGIESLLDILDRYTSKETVTEEQASRQLLTTIATLPPLLGRRALYYHVGLKHKAKLRVRSAVAAAERVRQSTARGRAEMWDLRLRRLFNDVLNELHIGWKHTYASHLRAYGRQVFATLRRVRKAKPGWRRKALARLDEWPVERKLDPEPFRRMKEAVMKLYEKMERAGALV